MHFLRTENQSTVNIDNLSRISLEESIYRILLKDDIESYTNVREHLIARYDIRLINDIFLMTIDLKSESIFFQYLFRVLQRDIGKFCGCDYGVDSSSVYKIYACKTLKNLLADFEFYFPEKQNNWVYNSKFTIENGLHLWSVVANRPKLSDYFWKINEKDYLRTCLFSFSVLRASSLSAKEAKNFHAATKFENQANIWEERALTIVSEGFRLNENLTKTFIVGKRDKRESLLELLKLTKSLRLISCTFCQTVLREIWTFPLQSDTTNYKTVFAIIFPFFANFLIKFYKHLDENTGILFFTQARQQLPQYKKILLFPIFTAKIFISFLKAPIAKFWLYQVN